jgi:hypothetical protein
VQKWTDQKRQLSSDQQPGSPANNGMIAVEAAVVIAVGIHSADFVAAAAAGTVAVDTVLDG